MVGSSTPTRYYYLSDHLGSVRATVNEQGTVVHHDDYYPFGAPMPGRNNVAGEEGSPEGKPRFTGHEQEVDIDPDFKAVYYAGARYYDALIGRWDTVDPKDYLFPSHSPYNYVFNNPVNVIDPDGECPPCTPEQTAFVAGAFSTLKSSVLGALDAATHPFRTARAVGSLTTPAGQAAAAVGLIEAGQKRVDLVQSGSLGQAFVAGEVTATVGEAVVGTKGAGTLLKSTSIGTKLGSMLGRGSNLLKGIEVAGIGGDRLSLLNKALKEVGGLPEHVKAIRFSDDTRSFGGMLNNGDETFDLILNEKAFSSYDELINTLKHEFDPTHKVPGDFEYGGGSVRRLEDATKNK